MSNQLYPGFKEALLRAFFLGESFANDVDLKVVIVGPGYTYDPTDSSLADIPIGDIVAPGVQIPSATISATAVVDAPDMLPAFVGLTPADEVAALVIYAEDAVTSETRLIGFIDTAIEGSLPFTIALEELNIRWPSGGIFGI